jgi:hypothetical protein
MKTLIRIMRQAALSASLHAATMRNRLDLSQWVDLDGVTQAAAKFWNQSAPGYRVQQVELYSIEWRFLLAAVVVSAVSELLVLALYAGWWQLGRRVSLNPLETAVAMGAPLLADVHSNAERARIVARVGARRVRYGGVVAADRRAPPPPPPSASRSKAASDQKGPGKGRVAWAPRQHAVPRHSARCDGTRRLQLVATSRSGQHPTTPRPGEAFV